MKFRTIFMASIIFLGAFVTPGQAQLDDIDTSTLGGESGLACQAILCLSSGMRPGECSPSLSHYFGLNTDRHSDAFTKRLNFLNKCPVMDSPGMPSLANAIANGAGYCDAEVLNLNRITYFRVYSKRNGQFGAWQQGKGTGYPTCTSADLSGGGRGRWGNSWHYEDNYSTCIQTITVIDDRMPSRCLNYINHEYTDLDDIKYVGDKFNGGKWVD